VTVTDGQAVDVVIALELAPVQLEEVRVTERRQPFDSRLAGFNERMQKKVGTFITRERIDASASTSFSDLLLGVPGVHLVASNAFRNAVRFRGQNCPPLVYVDGFAAGAGEFDIDMIDPASVEGVEIYTGMLTVPAALAAPRGMTHCGVIAVWSRPFRPPPRPRKTVSRAELQRMVEAAAIFTADEVDSVARLVPGTFSPVYPDAPWRAGTDGQALVEFVVDGLGRVDLQFFTAVSASSPEFVESVREALGRARFVPATKGGRHVRQLMRLPTRFEHPKPQSSFPSTLENRSRESTWQLI
jgi:TonB family protein